MRSALTIIISMFFWAGIAFAHSSGGAFGPISVDKLVRSNASNINNQIPSPKIRVLSAPEPASLMRVHSSDTIYPLDSSTASTEMGTFPSTSTASVVNSFVSRSDGAVDNASTTDGNYILTADENGFIFIYTMTGSVVMSTNVATIICQGSQKLPVCSGGGTFGDPRVFYDNGPGRWVISGLWFYGPSGAPAQQILLASSSNNPTLAWHAYQFPVCGSFDTWDASDQTRLGFNGNWIVITAPCSCHSGTNGTGLTVINKLAPYIGAQLVLNGDYFQFVDGLSGGPYCGVASIGGHDQPVRTYSTAGIGSREYLVAPYYAADGTAEVIYSYIDGSASAPVFHPTVETVTTSLVTTGSSSGYDGLPSVSSPYCPNSGCMDSLTSGWIHSAGVWQLSNGHSYVLSTQVVGIPQYAYETGLLSVALDTSTGAATALAMPGGVAGSGPMGSEIAMPLVNTTDDAVIGYDHSRFDFIPGVKDVVWNIPTNSVVSVNILQQGVFSPQYSNCSGYAYRFLDFLDAMQPIPKSGNLLIGGTYGDSTSYLGSYPSECSGYWAKITVP
jgi:hypothetical protein